jgi:Uma2 family endonuclease
MAQPRRRATYEDLFSLPDHVVGEIIEGELYASPRPASPHAFAVSAIGQDLGPLSRLPGGARGPGGWWILDEPELHFGADILVPDLAGWRQERMPTVPNVAYFELAPDWTCEAISPSTGRLDRVRKMPIYARKGVQVLWLVDPSTHTLEVYRLVDAHWVVLRTLGGDDVARIEPFEEIEIEVGRWWID